MFNNHDARPMVPALLALMRPRHWVKNTFVLLPLLFARMPMTSALLFEALIGFAAFCALSSAIYCLNDLMDHRQDAMHPSKRLRPLPSGRISRTWAWVLSITLAGAGLAMAATQNMAFLTATAAFLALNLAYCLHLKHHSLLDVLAIAGGFIIRMTAGGDLIGVQPSAWIISGTGLAALFLALSKRRDDLVLELDTDHRRSLSGYNIQFLDAALLVVLGAGLLCYILYTIDPAVTARLGTERLFYTVPFVVAGVLRYLQIIYVLEMPGDPTAALWADRFLQYVIFGWGATFALLIYS